jgi:hypothetical protein
MGLETFLQDNVPYAVVLVLALLGFYHVGSTIFSYVRLLASLFVLSGKNVRILSLSSPHTPIPHATKKRC